MFVVLVATAGGVLRWSVAIATVVACAAAVLAREASTAEKLAGRLAQESGAWSTPPRRLVPRFAWPMVCIAVFAVIATLPLPHALVSMLSPAKAALVVANSEALGVPVPAWYPISFDGSLSLLALVRIGLVVVVAGVAARLAVSSHGRTNMAGLVVATASLVAMATWLNSLLSPDYLWGVLKSPVTGVLTSPLLNMNHLAGLLGLAAPLAMALAVRAVGRRRMWWGASFVLLVATVLASGSRGGLLGLCVAIVVAMPLIVSNERLRLRHVRRAQLVAMIAVVLAVLTIWGISSQSISQELANTTTSELSQPGSKFMVWRQSMELLHQSPLSGVGVGAFEVAYSQFSEQTTVRYSHPENIIVQHIVELGLIGGGAALLLWGWVMVVGWRHAKRSSLRGAAWAGLLGVLVHDMFDFSMEMPLVICAVMVCASLTVPTPSSRTTSGAVEHAAPMGQRRLRGRGAQAALAAFALLAVMATWLFRSPSRDLVSVALTSTQAVPRLMALAAKHPSDDQTWTRLGEALLQRGDNRGFRALGRGVALNPANVNAHLVLAVGMSRSSARRQAPTEFAMALRLSRQVGLVEYAKQALENPAEVAQAIPIDREDVAFWLRELARTGHQIVAQHYAKRVGDLYPGAAEIQLTVAQTLMLVEPDAALRHAQAAESLSPSIDSAVAVAYALVQTEQVAASLAFLDNPDLEKRAQQGRHALPLYWARIGVGLLAAMRDKEDVQQVAPLLDRSFAASELLLQTVEDRNHWHTQAAQWQELQGNTAQADMHRAQITRRP